jgi:uncharacterized Zn finger protein
MKPIKTDMVIRQCNQCNRKFELTRGFILVNGYYTHVCKECFRINTNTKRAIPISNSDSVMNQRHLFEVCDDDSYMYKCKRCGTLSKRIATRKPDQYGVLYFIDNTWVNKISPCIHN